MFCPNCGTNLPDGAGFCSECGSRIEGQQPAYQQPVYEQSAYQQPVYEQPVYQQPVYEQSVYQQPVYEQPVYQQPVYQSGPAMKKGEYLKTQASPEAKKLVKISMGLLLVCVLVLALGLNACINGPFYKIPVVKMAMGEDYEEALDELTDILGEAGDEVDDFIEEYEDEVSSNELTKLAKAATKMAKNPSLNNVKKVGTILYENDLGGMNRSDLEAFDLVLTMVWIAFALVLLFTVLGGLLKKTGLVVTGLILSVPVCAIFSGVLYIVLSLVAHIALAVVFSKINKEYKAYKKGLQPSYGY